MPIAFALENTLINGVAGNPNRQPNQSQPQQNPNQSQNPNPTSAVLGQPVELGQWRRVFLGEIAFELTDGGCRDTVFRLPKLALTYVDMVFINFVVVLLLAGEMAAVL